LLFDVEKLKNGSITEERPKNQKCTNVLSICLLIKFVKYNKIENILKHNAMRCVDYRKKISLAYARFAAVEAWFVSLDFSILHFWWIVPNL